MVKIKLVDQQIESIVIDDLKLAYELNVEPNRIDIQRICKFQRVNNNAFNLLINEFNFNHFFNLR